MAYENPLSCRSKAVLGVSAGRTAKKVHPLCRGQAVLGPCKRHSHCKIIREDKEGLGFPACILGVFAAG